MSEILSYKQTTENNFLCEALFPNVMVKKQNDLNLNQINNNKSTSLLSIIDINMEIADHDLDKKFHSLNINEIMNEKKPFKRTGNVLILKEIGVNTDNAVVDAEAQTDNNSKDTSIDLTQAFLFLQGQTKDIENLTSTVFSKQKLVEGKIHRVFEQMSKFKIVYEKLLSKMLLTKTDAEVNTCESWLSKWDQFVNDSDELVDTKEELKSAQETIRMQELENALLRAQLNEQRTNNDQLTDNITSLQQERDSLFSEVGELRDTNEFLNAENQSLLSQIGKLQADFDASIIISDNRIRRMWNELRETRSKIFMDRREWEVVFELEKQQYRMDKDDMDFSEQRAQQLSREIAQFPLFGSDLQKEVLELRKRISHLEERRLVHNQEKQKIIKIREAAREECKKGNKQLNDRIEALQKHNDILEESAKEMRELYDRYWNCIDELRKLNQRSTDWRDPTTCLDNFRNILTKHNL